MELACIIMAYGWKMYKGNRAQNQDHPTEIFFLSLSRTQMSLFSSLFFKNSIQSWLSKSSRSSWFTLLSYIALQFNSHSFSLYDQKYPNLFLLYSSVIFVFSSRPFGTSSFLILFFLALSHTFLKYPFPFAFHFLSCFFLTYPTLINNKYK